MRLIDADALFREMEKTQWYNNADRDEIAEELVLNAPTIEPDFDTISRQATINAIQNHFNPTGAELSPDLASVLAGVGVVINTMPPAPQRTGRWEIYVISMLDGEGCKCSECGFEGVPYWDFCPNCGARMEGEG